MPHANNVMQNSVDSRESGFWHFVWLGIAISGGLLGLLNCLTIFVDKDFWALILNVLVISIIAFVVGVLLAGIAAIPVLYVVSTASRSLGSRRWQMFLALIAGGETGILATLPIAYSDDPIFISVTSGVLVAFAAGLGALGAYGGAMAWLKMYGQAPLVKYQHVDGVQAPIANRFANLKAFLLVVLFLVGACIGVAYLCERVRELSRQSDCRNRLKQIALCCRMEKGVFPPAYLTDKDGKPVLSWRVAVARNVCYHVDYSKQMDFDQPWDSPKNATFLNSLRAGFFIHCPSSGRKLDDSTTDYVAVIGPDTLWPGKTPVDLKNNPKGILAVEWPNSDIHWAEPRDITVEEFLDWFRKKHPRQGFWGWLFAKPHERESFHSGCLHYVDAEGNVGELRNDADPETVRKLMSGQ
jgi:hypothetical protein